MHCYNHCRMLPYAMYITYNNQRCTVFVVQYIYMFQTREAGFLKSSLSSKVTWVLGIWRGEGMEKVEKGEVSLQAT